MLLRLLREESGQTLTEYGLIVFFVAVVVIAAILYFQGALLNKYNDITNEIENSTS